MTAFDRLPQDKIKSITELLRDATGHFRGTYFNRIFDRRQTHAIYGVTQWNMDDIKKELKKIGANKFRTVKANGKGLFIVCFSVEKVK